MSERVKYPGGIISSRDIKIPIIEYASSENGKIIFYERVGKWRYNVPTKRDHCSKSKKLEILRISPVKSSENNSQYNSLELTLEKAAEELTSQSNPYLNTRRWKNILSRTKYFVFIRSEDVGVYEHLTLKRFRFLEKIGLEFRQHILQAMCEPGKVESWPIWFVRNPLYKEKD
jgi:hypothetical protein